MGVGYIVLIFVINFLIWILVDMVKDRRKRKILKNKLAPKDVAQTDQQNSEQTTPQTIMNPTQTKELKLTEINADQNKIKLVNEDGKLNMLN